MKIKLFIILYFLIFIILFFCVKFLSIIPVVVCIWIIALLYPVFYFLIKKSDIKKHLLIFCLAGVLIRIMFFNVQPEVLSDDVYRYIWDGKMQYSGINPYLYPPESSQLNRLKDNLFYPKINHKQYRTIYPPLSQFIFFISYIVSGNSFIFYRILYLFFEFLLCFLIYKFLDRKKFILLIIFSPILILEVYIGMHIDIIGVTLFVAALYFFKNNHDYPALIFALLSCYIKYIFIFALPLFFIYHKQVNIFSTLNNFKLQEIIKTLIFKIIITALITTALYLPFIKAGGLIFEQLFFYNKYWEFNASIYLIIKFMSNNYAATIKLILTGLSLIFIYFNRKLIFTDKIRYALWLVLLLSNVLYPWYLLWVVPFLAIKISKEELFLLSIIFISYFVLIKYKTLGIWEENIIISLIEYVPFYLMLTYKLIKKKLCTEKIKSQ